MIEKLMLEKNCCSNILL